MEFDDECGDLAIFQECSIKIMKKIDIDYEHIISSVSDCFGES